MFAFWSRVYSERFGFFGFVWGIEWWPCFIHSNSVLSFLIIQLLHIHNHSWKLIFLMPQQITSFCKQWKAFLISSSWMDKFLEFFMTHFFTLYILMMPDVRSADLQILFYLQAFLLCVQLVCQIALHAVSIIFCSFFSVTY